MGPTARACDEERSAELRASVGNIGVESPLVSRLIDCAVTALFVFGIYLGVMAWDCGVSHGGLVGARRWCGGYGMTAHLPLASVPIALTVAAFIDAALGGTSALARGKGREVSPLTPRLCAIMAIAFLWTCTAHLPSMCSTALRDLAAPGGEDVAMASTFHPVTAATYADEKYLARRSLLNPPPSSRLTESARYPQNSSNGGRSGNEETLEDGALRSGVGRHGDILGGVDPEDPVLSHRWLSTWVRAYRKPINQ